MRGSSTQTFVPNLLSPSYQKQFRQQAAGKGDADSLVTGGKPGEVRAYCPPDGDDALRSPTPLGRAGQ
jgi:hypothetical protein